MILPYDLPMTDPNGAAIYGVPWIPSIYPSHVSIYTSTMDPMGWEWSHHPNWLSRTIIFQRGRLKPPSSCYWDMYDPPSIGIFWMIYEYIWKYRQWDWLIISYYWEILMIYGHMGILYMIYGHKKERLSTGYLPLGRPLHIKSSDPKKTLVERSLGELLENWIIVV